MFDSLHIMVQLTGPGGNGKSTLIEFLMSFWDQKDIGVIPNNAQKTFPFEQAINYFMKLAKPCIVFPEIKSNTQIDMADVLRLCEAPDMFVFSTEESNTSYDCMQSYHMDCLEPVLGHGRWRKCPRAARFSSACRIRFASLRRMVN